MDFLDKMAKHFWKGLVESNTAYKTYIYMKVITICPHMYMYTCNLRVLSQFKF